MTPLTPAKIAALTPGRETDRLVTEAFVRVDGKPPVFLNEQGTYRNSGRILLEPPAFSTDWRYAGALMEHLKIDVECFSYGWQAMGRDGWRTLASNPDPKLAICKAALLAFHCRDRSLLPEGGIKI